jgi:rod shape-determining protein MreC
VAHDWRRPGTATVIVAVALGLLLRAFPAPVKKPVGDFFLRTAYVPFFALRNWATDVADLREENLRLKQVLAEASWRWQEREQFAREAERLRALLNRVENSPRTLRVGGIVGWERRGGRDELIVDMGRIHGIKIHTPVVTEAGLVGKVIDVMDRFARVQLLTDPACRVAVRDSRSGVLGVVRATQDRVLHMAHVGIEFDVVIGDSLITSGIGGIFPEGLHVGTVVEVTQPPDSLLKGIRVDPFAQLQKLDYVFFLHSNDPLPPGAPYSALEEVP